MANGTIPESALVPPIAPPSYIDGRITPAPTGDRSPHAPLPKRRPGEGHISQRKDKYGRPIAHQWRGELMLGYRPDGKPHIRYVSGISPADVQNKLRALRQEQHTSGHSMNTPASNGNTSTPRHPP